MNRMIVWFRRDLRLHDNPALNRAIEQRAAVLPVYIHSPDEEAPWAPGGASRWWLHHSLLKLRADLAARGLKLHCLRGNACDILPAIARDNNIAGVAANRLYDPHLQQRDRKLKDQLTDAGIEAEFFDSCLLFLPGSLLNQQGKPYRVFTPFWRNARRLLETDSPSPAPDPGAGRLTTLELESGCGDVESLGLLDSVAWYEKLHEHWQPGEARARRQLDEFIESGLGDYRIARDFPAQRGSSRLSPHLHFGEITPRQILHELMPHLAQAGADAASSIETFLSEIGWREFAHHVLWHFPHSSHRSMNPVFDDAFWSEDDEVLQAWQAGATGVPLVDAGMTELWQTGWMHNRVRMLVGSFLTKNLGIHWRAGARWFWDTLVDADLASNSFGWQWIAGCGLDAAPYYRIFNPETQATKFDPEQAYIHKWIGDRSQQEPLVDLAESRKRALARYQEVRQTS